MPDNRRTITIEQTIRFEAAHRLPHVPADHKCARLHGHSFVGTIFVRGPIVEPEGWLLDFADIKAKLKPIVQSLDHHYLNEIPGLENPTSENLAVWIWNRLKPELPELHAIRIAETCNNAVYYQPD